MKTILLLIPLLLALPAFAQAKEPSGGKLVKSFEIEEKGKGTLKVEVRDVGEPVYQPYRMTVSVRCRKDKKWDTLLTDEAICDFRPHEYAKKTKVMTLHFSSSEVAPGPAQCNAHWTQTFDLGKICD